MWRGAVGDYANNSSGFVAGEAADGRVWVELDGDGRLNDLYLDPRVAYLPLEELRAALIEAFTVAQDEARVRADEKTARYAETVAPDRLKAALAEASDAAERRFAEVSVALYDLGRRAARPW
jgi:DNA-binding protein YbaB